MKYIINNFNLFDLQAKLKNFLSKNYKNKYYKRIKQKYFHILIYVMIIMLIVVNVYWKI
ncbi:hypothetical protein [Spiroplasma citri]|uniref:hypothetical protein n=1 Tax=Spiroplasma citri TaxID=2133 RepID=UPI0019533545|nr:hypothetical protein [Spiroplasma citri]